MSLNFQALDITRMLQGSDKEANQMRLWESCYDFLKSLAQYTLRGKEISLTATSLVHELFLKIHGKVAHIRDREHFFAFVLRSMRQISVQNYRNKSALKRQAVTFPSTPIPENWVGLEQALDRLEKQNPRLARLVEVRYFAGFTREEAALLLKQSPATIDRDWLRAKTYLKVFLDDKKK